MNSGIYTITNKTNGHRYVGSSVNLDKRFRSHRRTLRKETHRNRYLQRAWNKYGDNAFSFEVLEECEPEFLVSMEQWWMNMLCPEYNICLVAGSSLGIKKGPLSEEHKAKVSAALKGHKISKETRAKISAANKGRKFSEEALANIRAAIRPAGWKHTKEALAKISVASKRGYRLGKGIFGQTAEQRRDAAYKGAAACKKKGVGIFAFSSEQLSENGKKSHRLGLGVHGLTAKQRKENYEKGLGKFTTKQRIEFGKMTRKLTQSQVHEIRHLLALGDMTQKEIAEHYQIACRSTISDIKTGRTYADW